MCTSFFKRERQYDTFKAKEIINKEIMPQQTSQIYMHTSFFKRERQIITRLERKKLSIHGYCHNKQAQYTCIYFYWLMLKFGALAKYC